MNQEADMRDSRKQQSQKSISYGDGDSQYNGDSDSEDFYELIPRENQILKPRADRPDEYFSLPFQKQDEAHNHVIDVMKFQQLIPLESQQRNLRSDDPVSYGSKPFAYSLTHKQNLSNFETIQQQKGRVILQTQIQAERQGQNLQREQNQKSDSQQRQSIVSKSSELQEDLIKKNQFTTEQPKIVPKNSSEKIKKFRSLEVTEGQRDQIFVNFQESHSTSSKASKEKSLSSQLISSRKIISVEGSQENEVEEILRKYHFQSQKDVSSQNAQIQNTDKKSKDQIDGSLQLINISPQSKGSLQNEVDISFSPKEEPGFPHCDPYEKYKRSAETSPIQENKQRQVLIANHKGFKRSILKKQTNDNKQSPECHHKHEVHFFDSPKQDMFEDEIHTPQQKLSKSMRQIDILRKSLLKSTQNNINAIFNTNLTGQDCHLAQMVEGIQKKVGDLYEKMEKMDEKRMREMEWEIEKMRIRERENQRQEKQMQRQRERREEMHQRNLNTSGNMILDLGKGSQSEGKIIAIYPANKMVSVKDLILGHSQKNPSQVSEENQNLKMMLELQQGFMKTLHQFQQQVNLSIEKKLQEIRIFQEQKESKKLDVLQKLERVSQETNDRDEQFDDSRGSINVIYLRKLRELEDQVKEKQWSIERLEKHNYQLQKQLEKWEKVIGNYQSQARLGGLPYKQKTVQDQFLFTKDLSFKKNPALDPNLQIPFLISNHAQQNAMLNFSKSPAFPLNPSNNRSISSSSQKQEQKIKETTTLTSEQLNFLNPYSKKKNTYSFHISQSKNTQTTELNEMKEKLSQYQLALKEKDIRIRELENTIMDHLESSRKWRIEKSESGKSSKISGYESVSSKQDSPEILHMKINNLKTLLKEAKKQAEKYEKLYEEQKCLSIKHASQQNLGMDTKLGEDMISNTSKSMCVSDKTTVKNQRNTQNIGNTTNSPFAEITQQDTTIQKSRQLSDKKESGLFLQNEQQPTVIETIVNFIMMAWSLKDVISKLCGKEVNVQKINRNARQFLNELKARDQKAWYRVCQRLKKNDFLEMLKGIWIE